MNHIYLFLFVAVVVAEIAASTCPPKMKVINRSPTCRDDYDCRKYYQICCPNAYNALSCTYPSPFLRYESVTGPKYLFRDSPPSGIYIRPRRKYNNTPRFDSHNPRKHPVLTLQ